MYIPINEENDLPTLYWIPKRHTEKGILPALLLVQQTNCL